jgi:hypothetical protein
MGAVEWSACFGFLFKHQSMTKGHIILGVGLRRVYVSGVLMKRVWHGEVDLW